MPGGSIFERDPADSGAVSVVQGGVPLLEGMEAGLRAGAALTFMSSDDGAAWAVSVLFDSRRVGRVWVRGEGDLAWLCDCLSDLSPEVLRSAWEAVGEAGAAKSSYALAKVQAKKSR